MKFLLDANLPYSAKEIFGQKHEVLHVRDVGLENVADDAILRYAADQKPRSSREI